MPEPGIKPIAYVTARFPRWSETFIQREVQLLVERGVPVVVFSLFPSNVPLAAGLPKPIVLSPPHELETGDDDPLPAIPSPRLPRLMHRYASLLKHARLLLRLRAELRERNIGHVHGAFADLPGLLAAAAARQEGLPYSISMHAADALDRKYDDRFLFANAAFITICNRRVHEIFIRDCPQFAARTHLIPHGIPLAEWPMRREPWKAHAPLRLLFVGRLVPRKRPAFAMAVRDRLQANGIPAELTVIGDGPLASQLLGREGVNLLGVLPPAQVREAMHTADLLLICSREERDRDMEGLPNIILEAMASGLPVAGTVTGSIGELLDDTTGHTCQATVDSCFDTMSSLLQDPIMVRKRLLQARERVTRDYDAQVHVERHIELYRQHST